MSALLRNGIVAVGVCAAAVAGAGAASDTNMTLTAVDGVKVGHVTLSERPTGCTVALLPNGTMGGVDVRGGAPGTRETDALNPINSVDTVNAIVLSGGSAFGLDSASGVMRWLEEHHIGYRYGSATVPIVPAAILFDLPFGGKPNIRPTADCGYKAAEAASSDPVREGNVGAGAGATAGHMMGRPMKTGIGSAAIHLPNGLVVAALVAVNAFGDVVDPTTGQVVAGTRTADGKHLADARKLLRSGAEREGRAGENTTIGIVATNAKLTKTQAHVIAQMAQDGYARAIAPVHMPVDGDTIFSAATGRWSGNVDYGRIGALAAEAMADAIVRAATQAASSNGVPSAAELGTVPARLR